MGRVRKVGVILLAIGLIVVIGVPKLWAQEGTCLILAEIAVEAMEFGYQAQSREACSRLVGEIMAKWEDKEIYGWEVPFYLPFLPLYWKALDLIAVSCLKGVELAEAGKPFVKEEAFGVLYDVCVNGE
ncbi:MAG: hypothetical protein ACTSSA_11965 [Candidatus Freyarchaeota archaeon]